MSFVRFDEVRALADELAITARHPQEDLEGEGAPQCTDCHDDDTVDNKPVKAFDHNREWYGIHKYAGSHSVELCNSCHKVSFCADCHGDKEELKPSLKHAGQPGRQFEHRGNYLFQHRIDGRIDPSKCFKCHGQRNSQYCMRCHKK
ncbi:cytochrome C [Thermodesulfobacteriota bacterium]